MDSNKLAYIIAKKTLQLPMTEREKAIYKLFV